MGIMKKIYIVHGWSYFTTKWKVLIDLLENKGFKVKLLKVPGLTAQTNKVWDIDEYVQWLKNKTKREKKFILLGHSNGGRISMAFTIKYAKKVSNLILIDSAGIYHNDLALRLKRSIFKILANTGKKIYYSEKFKNLLYTLARAKDYKNAKPVMKQTMINLINSDKDMQIGKISTPTIIIWGQKDSTTPLSDGKLINKLIKNSSLVVIKGARHSPQYTNPNQVAEIIFKAINL